MGIKACDRRGCARIMCDICVCGMYYLCQECAEEFKSQVGNDKLLLFQMKNSFNAFIATDKQRSGEMTAEQFLTGNY